MCVPTISHEAKGIWKYIPNRWALVGLTLAIIEGVVLSCWRS